ncbi:hypothetical protein [Rhodopila sp.]|uniref:hypothetical protein n=1 Tax=Rhodopila sp. TaxID=2480087 RepID=UPI003D105F4A
MDATDHLLGVIYEAALNPVQWPAALALLADAVGGVGAHVVVLDKAAGATGGLRPRLKVHGTRSMDPEVADRYMHEWHVFDPLLPAAGHAAGPPGTIMLCHEFLSDDFVAHDMYFQDFLIPSGGRYQTGVTLENDQDRLAVLDLHSRDAPLKRDEVLSWTSVIAHLRRAVRLSTVFTEHLERETMLRTAIERAGIACVLVNNDGRIADYSPAAEEMLARGSGVRLDIEGRVRLGNETDTRRLRGLITDACRGDGGGEIAFKAQGCLTGMIQVVPAGVTCDNPFSLLRSSSALLFVDFSRPRHSPAPDRIRLEFGCSPAEADVAAALASGRAPKEIAVDRATSVHTVRAQIHRLLETTGSHRIAELVGVIHADVKPNRRFSRGASDDSLPPQSILTMSGVAQRW